MLPLLGLSGVCSLTPSPNRVRVRDRFCTVGPIFDMWERNCKGRDQNGTEVLRGGTEMAAEMGTKDVTKFGT